MIQVTGIPLFLSLVVPLDLLPSSLCLFKEFTGIPCPFCGFTRAVWAISAGNWTYAVTDCPLACLLYGVSVIVLAWHLFSLLSGLEITPGRTGTVSPLFGRRFLGLCLVLLLVNWGYRLWLA